MTTIPLSPRSFRGGIRTSTCAYNVRISKLIQTPLSATVSQECISNFNDLKLAKKFKFIIFKLSDNNSEIVVEEASTDKDWEAFREKLVNAQHKSKSVCQSLPCNALATELQNGINTFVRVLSARDPDTLSTTSSTNLPQARVHGEQPLRIPGMMTCKRNTNPVQKQDHLHCLVSR